MGPGTDTSDSARLAAQLLVKVANDPYGSVSPSTYETGRVVAHAPWLPGHAARLEFLLRTQAPDGSWGGPEGYALVPTLSATGALLAELARRQETTAQPDQHLLRAARTGMRLLRRRLADPAPDTVAVELMVPALLAELSELLPAAAADWLQPPDWVDRRPLATLRAELTTGEALPEPIWHCLELFGRAAAGAPFVRTAEGGVAASAAATATWLGGPAGPAAGHRFLTQLVDRGGGPLPNVTPITYFEAAWVLNSLAIGGLTYHPPVELLDRLASGLTATGAPAGPGLPVDSDDTAAVMSALLRHGRNPPPEPLLGFQADGYFRCFVGERNPSVSANAHVLETLCLYLTLPSSPAGLAATAAMVADWLRDQQQPDGSWWDKWHASPYYATACCVAALVLHSGRHDQAAVDRAVAWVRETQRPDGSWGHWSGTVEETAYAVQILCLAGVGGAEVRRGAAFLADPPLVAEDVPLWHGKDLYTPVVVVAAARLAARHLAAQNLAAQNPAAQNPAAPHVPNPRTPADHPAAKRRW